jgi:predicted anti-sigma-YlaC factor YlaD
MTHPSEMSCQELVELVNEYLEGALEPNDRARFEAHLDDCEGCLNYLNQMRTTIELIGQVTEESVPGPAMDELMKAFRSWKAG